MSFSFFRNREPAHRLQSILSVSKYPLKLSEAAVSTHREVNSEAEVTCSGPEGCGACLVPPAQDHAPRPVEGSVLSGVEEHCQLPGLVPEFAGRPGPIRVTSCFRPTVAAADHQLHYLASPLDEPLREVPSGRAAEHSAAAAAELDLL